MNDIIKQAKGMISRGELDKALETLIEAGPGRIQNELIAHQFTLANLRQQERTIGKEINQELTALTWRVLATVDDQSEETSSTSSVATFPEGSRRAKTKVRIASAQSLLNEWQDKLEVAENPSEIKRSEREISRLKKIIRAYEEELS